MGLTISHNAFIGAYGAFNRLRQALGEAAGYQYAQWPGEPETALVDWGHVVQKNYYGEWDSMPCSTLGPDPLLLLIIHADDEGHLTPEHCALLADRLEKLLPKIDVDLDGQGHLGNIRDATQRLVAGCRAAATAGERLEFS